MHYPPSHLSDVLNRYVSRAGYTAGQLARLSGIPKATIVNWLEGRVKRPRGSEDLLKLAAILHLEEGEATELLQSAGHPSIAEFREQARQDDAEGRGAGGLGVEGGAAFRAEVARETGARLGGADKALGCAGHHDGIGGQKHDRGVAAA